MAQIEMRCVGLASLLFLAVVSVGANQLSEYRKQEAFLKQYPCGDPQPRIFELGEVIGEDVLKETTHGFTLSVIIYTLLVKEYLFWKVLSSVRTSEDVKSYFSI